MEFGVLGPLAVVSDAAVPVDLGPPKARAVLAVLLCQPGRVVGVDALVDALWPEAPPAAAVKNVQLYVHQLRRALGDAGRIRRRAGGYVLVAEPGEIDAQRFAALVDRHRAAAAGGDLDEARALLAQALGLWRGERAYAGIGDVPPVAIQARRLAEARLAALRARIDIDLRRGRHVELVPELVALTGEHPLDEGFWARLMTALHRSGRPAEALAAYDRARRVITAETGLDPGSELRGLQQAVLAGDGPPGPPSPMAAAQPDVVARMLPPDVGDFTGRKAERAVISAALTGRAIAREDADGVVPVVALTGQGGVGKTTLTVHAAHRLAGAYPGGQLFASLAGAQPVPAEPDEVLARFLRALGVPGRAVPDAGEERGAMYRSLVAGRKILVVLDDAADEAQVRPLLPGAASCAVIVTSRARLGGLAGARQVDLAPLPAEDGCLLLEQIAGPERAAAEPGAARELVALCAGLPLALRIAGSRLASRPHWSIGELAAQLADERRRLDTLRHRDLEVRASFTLSYRGLGADSQRLFRLLGLVDVPDVARWTAAALLDTSPAGAEELLETLADARLLEVTGPDEAGQRRYRFHDLVRLYARELAEAQEHAFARAGALSRVFAMLISLADAARETGDGGDMALITGTAPRWRAGEVVAELAAAPRSLAVLRAEGPSLATAVHQAAALGLDETCWELCLGAYWVWAAGAYFDDWYETHGVALAVVRAAGNQRGEAVMLLLLGTYHHLRRRLTEARGCVEAALTLFGQIGESYGQAVAMRKSSLYERHGGQFSQGIARARQARDLLTALGDPAAAADCLVTEGATHFEGGDPAAAAGVLAQAVGEARALGSWTIVAQGSYWLALADLALGQREEAAAAAAELSEAVRTVGDQIGAVYSRHARGCLARAMGDLAASRRELEQGLAEARAIHDPLMQVRILTDLGELCQAEARPAEVVGLLTEAVTVSAGLDFPLPRARALRRLGDARAAAGDPDGAHAAWQEAAAVVTGIKPRCR